MELASKCDLIYGLQQVTGKILMSKNLEVEILMTKAQNGTTRTVRTVTASIIIAQVRGAAQGQMSHWGCGNVLSKDVLAIGS
jgi:hypothetical protein